MYLPTLDNFPKNSRAGILFFNYLTVIQIIYVWDEKNVFEEPEIAKLRKILKIKKLVDLHLYLFVF